MKRLYVILAGLLVFAPDLQAQRQTFRSGQEFIQEVRRVHGALSLSPAESDQRFSLVTSRLLSPGNMTGGCTGIRIENFRGRLSSELRHLSTSPHELRAYLEGVDAAVLGEEVRKGQTEVCPPAWAPPQGATPIPGDDGYHCWDLNMNRISDVSEDVNRDGVFSPLDCRGQTVRIESKKSLLDYWPWALVAGVVGYGIYEALTPEGAPQANAKANACAVIDAECPNRDNALVSRKLRTGFSILSVSF